MILPVMLIMTKGDGFLSNSFEGRFVSQSHAQNKEKRDQEDDHYNSYRKNPRPDRMPWHVLIVQFASVTPLAPVDDPGMRCTPVTGINILSAVYPTAPFHKPPKTVAILPATLRSL
jgi:hypothetical protein